MKKGPGAQPGPFLLSCGQAMEAVMHPVDAADAQSNFDSWIDAAQSDPVEIIKDGKLVAVMLSPAALGQLVSRGSTPPDPGRVETLMRESIRRHGKVYEALADWERKNEPPPT